MNKSNTKPFEPKFSLSMALLLAFAAVTFLLTWNLYVLIGELTVTIAYILYRWFSRERRRRQIELSMKSLISSLDTAVKDSIIRFPLPISVVRPDGEIVWYNERFGEAVGDVMGETMLFGYKIQQLIPGLEVTQLSQENEHIGDHIKLGNRHFNVYGHMVGDEAKDPSSKMALLYWIDNTELYELRDTLQMKKPVVAVIMIDNYDEMLQSAKEEEKVMLMASLDERILAWASEQSAIAKRVERDKYYLIMDDRSLEKCIETRFPILDRVRELTLQGRMQMTLSIGIGRDGDNYPECDEFARQAIDMALGRGGDQAVIKDRRGFEFYGGKTQPIEKRTKVKARVMAAAMDELIGSCSNILIMGHRYCDLDSYGASVGLARIAKCKRRQVNIVLDNSGSLEPRIIEDMKQNPQYQNVFINSDMAIPLITENTLLFIVDTHRPEYLESAEVFDHCGTVVVIDHHKKGTNYISRAALFYHEPFASSCCEIVAELMQYFDLNGQFLKQEAEALLAGIVLDTKNFTFKTGIRTFEAASFLRKSGADTVEVKKLFQSDHNSYIKKMEIVSKAQFYRDNVAIAISTDDRLENAKTIIAQAADELLNISGVEVSFVLQQIDDAVHISARSLGNINVQVIVERLGGGGHHTNAGAQLQGATLAEAEQQLKAAIDSYFESEK